ncbi:C40 family peptidase [Rathayibacter iranicus]|uniref:NlpC/P60 domain-containing protein n=1 Tax=Rathayibacter iranicus TaxID=59737 RepID=A0AAD1ELE5_9MICO|nr:hypothetical protein C7V51_02965 [Rathayibacter iranicus]MWV32439.1 hypothetical protein [Rathayibacter iranicus NCPPB 2253 = VKM Ac-1602]PPI62579.1 hypothetical protein C5E08_02970 [Rathayibacter iranicus]
MPAPPQPRTPAPPTTPKRRRDDHHHGVARAHATFGAGLLRAGGPRLRGHLRRRRPLRERQRPNDSFDCDGYTRYVLAAFGIDLPRDAFNQSRVGTQIPISEAQAGDLRYWPDGDIGFYDGNGGMYDSRTGAGWCSTAT